MNPIVLRRSLRLWILVPVAAAIGVYNWHAMLTGTDAGGFYGRKARDFAIVLLPVAAMMVFYDVFLRFIRKDRIEFSPAGIMDVASEDRLGEIWWRAIGDIEIIRQWMGCTLIVYFKKDVPLNDKVEKWDKIVIGSLEISRDAQDGIMKLLVEKRSN